MRKGVHDQGAIATHGPKKRTFSPALKYFLILVLVPVSLDQIPKGSGSSDLLEARVGVVDHALGLTFGHVNTILFVAVAPFGTRRAPLFTATVHVLLVDGHAITEHTLCGTIVH